MSVMSIIEECGYYCDDKDNPEVKELYVSGQIQSLIDAGINFMNDSYIYIKTGNPDKVYVKDCGYGYSKLTKGLT
jgi:hypothetical protein